MKKTLHTSGFFGIYLVEYSTYKKKMIMCEINLFLNFNKTSSNNFFGKMLPKVKKPLIHLHLPK